jgi:hypothetical protein
MNNEEDPLWKRTWKTLGIRYLGKDKTGHIDHMDRFEHAFELGFQAGVEWLAETYIEKFDKELLRQENEIYNLQTLIKRLKKLARK